MNRGRTDYPCGKDILDIVYSGTVTDLANGSSQNNASSALIRRQALGMIAVKQNKGTQPLRAAPKL